MMITAPRTAMFRADAGRRVGAGHVMRSLSIAAELRDRGFDTIFASNATTGLLDRIVDGGHRVVTRPHADADPTAIWPESDQIEDARSIAAALGAVPGVVVVDHYGLDHHWESRFRSSTTRVLALDDLANRVHDVDVLSDQNWYGPDTAGRYDDMIDSSSICLLGPRYAVLQPPYRNLPSSIDDKRWPPRRCTVSFGGTDPGNETLKVVRALNDPFFAKLHVDVAVGSAATVDDELTAAIAARPRTELYVELPSLAELFAGADLAIGASGAATWERIAARVPAVVATVAPHQSGVTSALAAHGFSTWVGLTADTSVELYRSVLRRLWADRPAVVPSVIDGFGAARLGHALVPRDLGSISIRPAELSDSPACLGLDAEAGAASPGLLDGPLGWNAAAANFAAELADGAANTWLIAADGIPIGCAQRTRASVHVRLQACERRAEVSEHVASLVEQAASRSEDDSHASHAADDHPV